VPSVLLKVLNLHYVKVYLFILFNQVISRAAEPILTEPSTKIAAGSM